MKRDNAILEMLLKYIGHNTNIRVDHTNKSKQKCSNTIQQIEKAYSKFKVEPIRGLYF
jgi:hypothetical protein